jgi:hypothetical protein
MFLTGLIFALLFVLFPKFLIDATTPHFEHLPEMFSSLDGPMNLLRRLHNHSKMSHDSDIGMNSSRLSNLYNFSGISRVDIGINLLRKIYNSRSNNKSTAIHTANSLHNVKVPFQFPTMFNSSVFMESFDNKQERYNIIHRKPFLLLLLLLSINESAILNMKGPPLFGSLY